MTDPRSAYACPADSRVGETGPNAHPPCGEVFPTHRGAVLHAIQKKDEHHSHIQDGEEANKHLEEFQKTKKYRSDIYDLELYDDDEDGEETDVLEPEIPDSGTEDGVDENEDLQETQDCPNCGEDLEANETEIQEMIEEKGGVWCDSCGYEIVIQ